MQYGIIILLSLWFSSSIAASVLNVPADFSTIQSGIDAAIDDDTIMVSPGTYTGRGNKNLRFLDKSIIVMSQEGPELTVIDCEGDGGGADLSGNVEEYVLQGFTITNARYDDHLCGAIYCRSGRPLVRDCILIDNIVPDLWGGGLHIRYSGCPTVLNTKIVNNEAYNGGGVYNDSYYDPEFIQSVIAGNTSHTSGGGIYCFPGSDISLMNCTVVDK